MGRDACAAILNSYYRELHAGYLASDFFIIMQGGCCKEDVARWRSYVLADNRSNH
jgi:hypothetical protein